MSNDKGRDWETLFHAEAPDDLIYFRTDSHTRYGIGWSALARLCNWAESIIKKELAEKVEKMETITHDKPWLLQIDDEPVREFPAPRYVRVSDVLSLLTDKGKEQ